MICRTRTTIAPNTSTTCILLVVRLSYTYYSCYCWYDSCYGEEEWEEEEQEKEEEYGDVKKNGKIIMQKLQE